MLRKKTLIALFGFISGFTILITGNILNFWLAKNKINTEIIGLLSIVSLPYAFNFLWSPIVDQYKIPYFENKFGHRYSWVMILHFFMAIFIFFLSFCNPNNEIKIFCIIALIISFFSSTKDAVLNAWRSEIMERNNQAQMTGLYIFGYRIGLLISSSVTIYVSTIISWSAIYRIYSVIVLLFPLLLYFFSKNYRIKYIRSDCPSNQDNFDFKIFIRTTIKSYGGIGTFIFILSFLILYKLPDNLLNSMINIFILHLNYNEYEIASIGKFLGVFGAIVGGFLASYLFSKISIIKSLYVFGIIHAFSLLFFLNLLYFKHNLIVYTFVIGFQSITGGMTMASYIAYITSLCHGKYRATQYSLFTSMMGLSKSFFPIISGYIVNYSGWSIFYIVIFLASIPAIIMTKYLYNNKENR
jgi:PAT family beta-lactamase induction signal transducer AmpG